MTNFQFLLHQRSLELYRTVMVQEQIHSNIHLITLTLHFFLFFLPAVSPLLCLSLYPSLSTREKLLGMQCWIFKDRATIEGVPPARVREIDSCAEDFLNHTSVVFARLLWLNALACYYYLHSFYFSKHDPDIQRWRKAVKEGKGTCEKDVFLNVFIFLPF